MKSYKNVKFEIIDLSRGGGILTLAGSGEFTPGENETPLQPIGVQSGKENEWGTF